jgi:hypothetical protein
MANLKLAVLAPAFLFSECVANPGKITLQDAMKDVVNSMYAFEVQEYIRAIQTIIPRLIHQLSLPKWGHT